jgi:hypothetical protein
MTQRDELRMNPAALGALLRGDLENALIAMRPGGIEAQEARGQRDFVASETLPGKMNSGTREELEAMGIVYLEQADNLFWNVRLPEGWKKVPTDHSMWSDLLDDKGRKRAAIFYKAAFYDRNAHIDVCRRFSYCARPVNGWSDYSGPYHGAVLDGESIIWQTAETLDKPERPDREWYAAKDALENQAGAWLQEHYPDWQNRLAYWD